MFSDPGVAMLLRSLTALALLAAAAAVSSPAGAADPCAVPAPRALVLGSGGSKGAFETGAIYHLVVDRGCDFVEISGNSVGALNGALLAQAARSDDPARSLANLRDAAEGLIDEWATIQSRRDAMRARPLGRLRFALFGLDSIENFEPLRAFVGSRVSLDRLAAGRELRVGTMSFEDGRYREVLINRDGRVDRETAHDFISASAIVPVFGRMPVLTPPHAAGPMHLGDGTVRHGTPVTSYFETCAPAADGVTPACKPLTGANTPPHPRIEQLFVVVTSPYARRDDARPIFDPDVVGPRSGRIDNGRKILVRTFDLLVDTTYQNDLDDMLTYNDLLAWQAGTVAHDAARPFPLGSFNRATDRGVSLPYDIGLVAPEREDADSAHLFDVTPQIRRRELYCGCVAADALMQARYGQASMADRCSARFPALQDTRRRHETVPVEPAMCRDERTGVSSGGD
jgi:predicted acylesterase/phospholipase RssA